ncbi:MAG: hypothetical protein E7673_01405 [Ruminococcaceae bacterium]|nr:hypothetical protein [Oscillospiraceae bacterium]
MIKYGSHEFYRDIQSNFIAIRFYSAESFDDEKNEKLIHYKDALKPFYEELKNHINENENHVLIYCIDTLLDIIEEGDWQKVNLFADTVHNMPEICMGARALKTFRSEISAFRSRYGAAYFPF